MLQIADQRRLAKPVLKRLLENESQAGWCTRTEYLPAGAPASADATVVEAVRVAGESDTGHVVFAGDARSVVVSPPFPLKHPAQADGADIGGLVTLLDSQPLVGVVLLRLGRYALAVLRGDKLVASKTRGRYVKNRHRAGGTSQHRFARSRERLVRELFDKACEEVRGLFAPYAGDIDHVMMGGERHTLRQFVERCRYMRDLEPKTLSRLLQVDRPDQKTLDGIVREVWMSRVVTLEISAPE